jgi:phosphoribosylanthranilate isomerase
MNVKVCGITRLEDAEFAIALGAWALGFNLWPPSPRSVDPGVAAGIERAVRRRVETVGVFVNQPLDEIVGLVDALNLTHVQLHGDEGPSFCSAVAQRTGAKVIKALRIAHASDLQDVERYHTDYHLLDTQGTGAREMYGGTGRTWDWTLLAHRRSKIPLLVAGGLNAENVAEAIAATRPWGVDVNSGVESAPGIKDHNKLEAFFTVVDGDARPEGEVAGRSSPQGLVLPPVRGAER